MRLLISVLMLVMAVLPSKAQVKEGAHLKFEQMEYDFGEVSRRGENRSCVFRFVNDGTEPLVIISATTTCSCLKAEFSRKPIAVGEGGQVKLTVESKKVDKGIFHRVVQIRSTSVGGTEILTIKGISKD